MVVNEILKDGPGLLQLQQKAPGAPAEESGEGSFVNTLKGFVSDVNGLQKDSAGKVESFIKGEPVDLHDVMIAAEKAKTGFQLLVQMQSKFVDMYREISRMQV